MDDDFPAELDRAYERVEDLEQQLNTAKLFERKLRNKAWWKTYRAALTGLLAFPGYTGHSAPLTVSEAHAAAALAANLAHGPIDGRRR